MTEGNFIAYYRVSTDRQGRSGLGLEAQQQAVLDYLDGGAGSWSPSTPTCRCFTLTTLAS